MGKGVLVDEDALKAVRSLFRQRGSQGHIKGVAVALIAAPEPITTAIGFGILGALKLSEKGASVQDLFNELNDTLEELSSLSL